MSEPFDRHEVKLPCECTSCSEMVALPTGEATSIRRHDGNGPVFFCSEGCAKEWDLDYAEDAPSDAHHFPMGYNHTGGVAET